jgi:hypothetical protein
LGANRKLMTIVKNADRQQQQEKETGQLVAAMLNSEGKATDKPSRKYKSVVHGCEIDLRHFTNWLVTISPEILSSI